MASTSSLPQSMNVVSIDENGGTEVLKYRSISLPTLSDGQVLVRNHFSGVNYIDTYFRTGLYKAPSFPMTLGREAAGEIVAVHPSVVSNPKYSFATVGAKVCFMEAGTYAEYTALDVAKVVPVPENLGLDIAAASFTQGLTAWTFIREAAAVKEGQWTLVHAAAGGVGSLLVQMLKIVGAKIIATAGSDEKCALAKKLGAGWTINSHSDVVAQVKEITGGHGIDAIFDGVGKATFDADLEMIAMKGTLISFGNASGAVDPVNILRLGPKNVKLMRPIVNGYVAQRDELEKYAGELFDLVASKKVHVSIHKVYNLADVASAHADIESRKTTGKLLIKCI